MTSSIQKKLHALIQAYLFGNSAAGLTLARQMEAYGLHAMLPEDVDTFALFYGLLLAAVYQKQPVDEQARALEKIRELRTVLETNQQDDAQSHGLAVHLLSAELARITGRDAEAMRGYEQAIQAAGEHEDALEAPVVNECAAGFYMKQGMQRLARGYVLDACAGYQHQNLPAKIAQLQAAYPDWLQGTESGVRPKTGLTKRSTTKSLTSITPVTFDMMAVVKASQMLSEEVRLTGLLRRLLHVVIEQASATTGIFLAWENGHLLVRTKANARPGHHLEFVDAPTTDASQASSAAPLDERHDLPVSIVNYVVRLRQPVIMNDVAADPRFRSDHYLNATPPKSLLCLPVLHQNTLDGVLYLENALSTNTFTPERLEVLTLLTAQAGISLENATIYEHLEQKVQERTANLAAATARFQALSEATFEGLIIHDRGRILEVNTTMERLSGFSKSDLLERRVYELLAPESRKEAQQRLRARAAAPFQAEGLRRNGTVFPVELQSREIVWQDRSVGLIAIRDMSWRKKLEEENLALRVTIENRDFLGELVGRSPAMHKVYARLLRAAAIASPVTIYGETGTGKELAARTLFALSHTHTRVFVPVNCAAIPDTLFESQFFGHAKGAFTGAERHHAGYFNEAEGGTLFLDEIAEVPLAMQARLLRVLNDQTYTPVGAATVRQADVRIIAATNRNLRDQVREGAMRKDFFHRLHVINIQMPPLRQRKEDIPILIAHFFTRWLPDGQDRPMIPVDVMDRFMAYDWPGNVRELFNELQRYTTMGEVELGGSAPGETVSRAAFPFLQAGMALQDALDAFEEFYVTRAIDECGGQKKRAAAALGIDRSTLYVKLNKFQKKS